ncbi:MAG TPA: cation-translocating P-type ATPase [Flavipsychrobacter sp.]|nr:cation-translocating P-type ATPase [Flavipsychrobacter sp.]
MKIEYPYDEVYTLSVAETASRFQTDVDKGLSQSEADIRSITFGSNSYEEKKQKSIGLMLLLQLKSPIVYLLLAAGAVTLYFHDYLEAGAIGIVIIVNALIGFFMELQARSSMNALKEMDVMLSRVIRDGESQKIPSERLVPGDLIFLEAGDMIPGDARLVVMNQLQCDESSLTGESVALLKDIEALPKETQLADRRNMVFKGTSVMNGNGRAVITAISRNTQLGTITSLVADTKETATPLDKKLSSLAKKLIWITLVMTVIFAVTGWIQGKSWVVIFETAIALAVAAFPEGLPVVSTVALAYGMLLMARRNAIVKKLSVVETLGSTNVILTDKTGTLTENEIHVDSLSFPAENIKVQIENDELRFEAGRTIKSKVNFEKLKLIAALCNDAVVKMEEGIATCLGDPIEIALIHLANTSGTTAIELKGKYERIAEMPFSAETKMMGTLHKSPAGDLVAAKGSAEHLLLQCNRIQTDTSIDLLTEDSKETIRFAADKMAAQGLRVLAFAFREEAEIEAVNYLKELVYIGMIGFLDPPRADIKEAILTCRKAGIKIIMITGDHPLTALNIAKETGLVNEDEKAVLAGKDLPAMESLSDEWKEKVLNTAVFARTTPRQKLEIAGVYQAAGNIVAMTGDGVNDAPALKKADVGIAMGLRGTQVAKETAGIILKDDSFNSIATAVAHGREIFRNIQLFVIYLVSCNLSEILIVTSIGFFSPASTLLPLQILFLNMVTDVFPALALGVGQGDKTVMDRPPRNPGKEIITNRNWLVIILYAAAITISVIAAVLYCKYMITADSKVENNVAFITLAFAQLFHVFNMSAPHSGLIVNEVTKNKFVWWALFICVSLMIIVYVVPQLRLALGLVVLPATVWLVCIIAALFPLSLVQLYKLFRSKYFLKISAYVPK